MKYWSKVLLLMLLFLAVYYSDDITAHFKEDQSGLNWNITEGVLTISSKGRMQDYKNTTAPWRLRDTTASDVKSIVVEPGITYIGKWAFQSCDNVRNIYIPDSVKSFGDAAFYNCGMLEEIRLPARIYNAVLPVSLFDHCSKIHHITIPESVKTIKKGAFNSCESLKWVYIPATVKTVEDYAFNYCISLEDIYFGGSSAAWNEVKVMAYNDCLQEAVIHFNSDRNALPADS